MKRRDAIEKAYEEIQSMINEEFTVERHDEIGLTETHLFFLKLAVIEKDFESFSKIDSWFRQTEKDPKFPIVGKIMDKVINLESLIYAKEEVNDELV